MVNNMGSAAILRRWISRRLFRSDANSNYYPRWRANRMISSTGGGVSSSESAPAAPWVMLSRSYGMCGGSVLKFYCLAKNEVYSFFIDEYKRGSGSGWRWKRPDSTYDFKCVGSSHGWLALYNPRTPYLLLLSEPTSDRLIKLPSLDTTGGVRRLILDEKGRLAFISFGSGAGRLAFCSPGRSDDWTLFDAKREKKRVFDNFVYSSRHNRLFCLTENVNDNTKLECWDVDVESPPRLEWMMDFDDDDVDDRKKLRLECDFDDDVGDRKKLKYIVCAEHTGELFLVVRHVSKSHRPVKAYTTLDFDVYKIDREGGKMMRMEDSLEGLAMFVGINHSFAMPALEVSGLKPNSVYFAWDNRLTQPDDAYAGGIFDYQTRDFSHFCISNTDYLGYPVWFTPRPISV